MILDFTGGVRPVERTRFSQQKIKSIDSCSAVCLFADIDAVISVSAGTAVKRGELLGENGGTPVYSPIAGRFSGILEIEGQKYFTVMNKGESGETVPFEPESRPLTEMNRKDITESARKLAIIDARSGQPLWKLLEKAGKCRRVVIDCTESDPLSAINNRLCIEKARSVVGGAKILVQATEALKCVFAAEYNRERAFKALEEFAGDKKLFAMAPMEEKYPYGDRALMSALYVQTLKRDENAMDYGVLIVSAETAAALYDAMVSGMPQLDRYITFCGGVKAGGNLRIPRGITMHDLTAVCGGVEKDHIVVENSLLCGRPIGGVIKDSTTALIAVKPQPRKQTVCISCGRCAGVCPMRLMPNFALSGKTDALAESCIACGACDFICPAGLPLLSYIMNNKEEKS